MVHDHWHCSYFKSNALPCLQHIHNYLRPRKVPCIEQLDTEIHSLTQICDVSKVIFWGKQSPTIVTRDAQCSTDCDRTVLADTKQLTSLYQPPEFWHQHIFASLPKFPDRDPGHLPLWGNLEWRWLTVLRHGHLTSSTYLYVKTGIQFIHFSLPLTKTTYHALSCPNPRS